MKVAIVTLGIHFGIMVLGFVYSCLVLYAPAMARFRIQQKPYRRRVLSQRLPLIGLNLAIFYALNTVALVALADWFDMGPVSVGKVALQFLIILVVDDAYFYFYHRLLHKNRFLMRTVHRIHHRVVTPFPLEYIYVHPLEWLLGAIGPFLGILIQGGVSAWALWAYTVWRTVRELAIHSGIRSSWIFERIPLMGTNEHHDLHHSHPFGNYSSTLKLWDRVLGTEIRSVADVEERVPARRARAG